MAKKTGIECESRLGEVARSAPAVSAPCRPRRGIQFARGAQRARAADDAKTTHAPAIMFAAQAPGPVGDMCISRLERLLKQAIAMGARQCPPTSNELWILLAYQQSQALAGRSARGQG